MRAGVIWSIVTVLGLTLVVSGIIILGVGPKIVKQMVKKTIDITDEDSDGYEYFIKPPVPVKIKFTFMAVSNHEAVIAGTEMPNLEEKGPYTYREDMIKKDLSWTDGGDQYLEFGQYKTYTFLPSESCTGCSADDKVRILNMPVAGLIATVYNMIQEGQGTIAGVVLGQINKWLEGPDAIDELFALTTVNNFLFYGIKTGAAGAMMTYGLTHDRLPPIFTQENGFALFNRKQDTSENECYQVESSAVSWDRHTMITKWGKDSESLEPDLSKAETASWTGQYPKSWWPYADANNKTGAESSCNQLRGTDGHQFPPFVNKDDQPELWLFNTVPCRSIFMRYQEEVKIEGITTLEYSVPEDGANINKKINVCACKELSDLVRNNDTCLGDLDGDTLDISSCPPITQCYDGLQDVTRCQGAPTFISYPHFYLAPAQQKHFTGLEPDKMAHRTVMNVEPHTGMTLSLHSRIQLNIPLYNNAELNDKMPFLANITTVPAFPVLWIDEGADIDQDPEMVKKLKKQLVTPLSALNIGQWVAIGLGIAVTVAGGAMTFVKCRK